MRLAHVDILDRHLGSSSASADALRLMSKVAPAGLLRYVSLSGYNETTPVQPGQVFDVHQ